MNKITTRFGEIEYDPAHLLNFPKGLVGFQDLRDFVVMPNEKEGPLFWIQSVEDPLVAFVLTDPTQFFFDYRIIPNKHERQQLGINEEDDCFILSVVTVHPDRSITLNLAAPVLFAPETNRALQVILENSFFSHRTPLPDLQEKNPS